MLSGLLLVAAQPPYSWWPAAWLCLLPILLALRGAGLRRRLLLGGCCGFVWSFGVVGLWLWPATEQSLAIGSAAALLITLAATQLFGGFYMVLFCALAEPCRRAGGALALAALWVACEWLRGWLFGGLPWALLGTSQWQQPVVLQTAAVCGVAGVSFLLVACSAALAGLLDDRRSPAARRAALATALLVAGCLAFGQGRLARAEPGRTLPVLALSSAWPRFDGERAEALLGRLRELQRGVADEAALTVWPEGSLRFYLQEHPRLQAELVELARASGAPLLLGGPRFAAREAGLDYYNSAFLISPDGTLALRDKRALVPLAEKRWPLLPGVVRAFRGGGDSAALVVGEEKVGVLICFEAIFADLSRDLVDAGADLLVNITNDVLLGAGAEQMAAAAVLRSVENRVPLLRVANLGPTLLVDSYGRIVAAERGYAARVVQVPMGPGAARRRWPGRLFELLCVVAAVAAAALGATLSSRSATNSLSQRSG